MVREKIVEIGQQKPKIILNKLTVFFGSLCI